MLKRRQTSPPRGRALTAMVSAVSGAATRGVVRLGVLNLPCALGRGGRRARKREGDGATPVGRWQVLGVLYRADRVQRPLTSVSVRSIARDDGWCDAPADRNYNRPVCHPYPASAERLWRTDGLYDIIVVTSHNALPRVRGGGSAVFVHVAQPNYAPTEGCIALGREHLLRLLQRLGRGGAVRVLP